MGQCAWWARFHHAYGAPDEYRRTDRGAVPPSDGPPRTFGLSSSGGADALLEGSPLSTRPERYPDPGLPSGGLAKFTDYTNPTHVWPTHTRPYMGAEGSTHETSVVPGADLDTSRSMHHEPTLSVSHGGSGVS